MDRKVVACLLTFIIIFADVVIAKNKICQHIPTKVEIGVKQQSRLASKNRRLMQLPQIDPKLVKEITNNYLKQQFQAAKYALDEYRGKAEGFLATLADPVLAVAGKTLDPGLDTSVRGSITRQNADNISIEDALRKYQGKSEAYIKGFKSSYSTIIADAVTQSDPELLYVKVVKDLDKTFDRIVQISGNILEASASIYDTLPGEDALSLGESGAIQIDPNALQQSAEEGNEKMVFEWKCTVQCRVNTVLREDNIRSTEGAWDDENINVHRE